MYLIWLMSAVLELINCVFAGSVCVLGFGPRHPWSYQKACQAEFCCVSSLFAQRICAIIAQAGTRRTRGTGNISWSDENEWSADAFLLWSSFNILPGSFCPWVSHLCVPRCCDAQKRLNTTQCGAAVSQKGSQRNFTVQLVQILSCQILLHLWNYEALQYIELKFPLMFYQLLIFITRKHGGLWNWFGNSLGCFCCLTKCILNSRCMSLVGN